MNLFIYILTALMILFKLIEWINFSWWIVTMGLWLPTLFHIILAIYYKIME